MRVTLLVVMCAALLSPLAMAASFDCTKTTTFVEKAVCADPELSRMDDTLSERYKAMLKDAPDQDLFRNEQRAWLRIRDACSTAGCVRQAYTTRLATMKSCESIGRTLRNNKEGDLEFDPDRQSNGAWEFYKGDVDRDGQPDEIIVSNGNGLGAEGSAEVHLSSGGVVRWQGSPVRPVLIDRRVYFVTGVFRPKGVVEVLEYSGGTGLTEKCVFVQK